MRPRLTPLWGFVCLCLSTVIASGQIVWDGDTTNRFSNGSNWAGNAAPGVEDTAQFGNHGGFTTIMVNSITVGHLEFLGTRTAVHNLTYDDGPPSTLTLNGNFTVATGPAVNFVPFGSFQVNLALSSGEHVFEIGASTTVTIASVVSGTGHLSKVGSGTLVLTGVNTLDYDNEAGFNNGIAVDGGTLELNGGSITQAFNDIIVGSVSGGTGTLLVSNGGDVTAKYGVAGNDVSTNGTITVTGAGSTWTNSDGMALGYLGSGTLNVLAGGTVNTTGSGGDHSYLGLQSGTTGTATVSGTGSAWTTPNDQLIIGGNGTGNLTVSTGGLVSNTGGFVGLDATGAGTVTVNNGTWTNSAELIVANSGSGTLAISNGGDVTNTYSYVATQSGSNGNATVDGAGSTWTNSGLLAVGQGGTGSLAITNGGVVASTEGYVGYAAGSSGTVSVMGTGSAWTTSANLTVGNSGTGVLTLADSGKVNINSGTGTLVLGDSSGSNGTLNIGATAVNAAAAGGIVNAASIATGAGTGALQFNTTATVGARYYLTKDGTAGGTPVIISGATSVTQTAGYTVLTGANTYTGGTFINGGYLLLGDFGTSGSITGNVVFGGTVDPNGGELQFLRSDAYAFAGNITGPGRVSNFGSGTTTLSGANTYSGETFVDAGGIADGVANALSPNSIFRINSGALLQVNHNETIAGLDDYTPDVSGTANVASGRVLTLGVNGSRTFSGVIAGAGSLAKTGFGTQILAGTNTYTGGSTVTEGTVNLTGSLTHGTSDFLLNGSSTTPQLNITGGGDLVANRLRIGITNSSFSGNATVDGSGSTVTTNTYLYVGEAGLGHLTVTNGGLVSGVNTSIGNNSGGDGALLVNGAGSTLTNTDTLYVGSAGVGYLDISAGGLVTNGDGRIGNNPGGTGDVYLDTGGTWTSTGTLTVGNAGSGDISAFGGSSITAANATIGALSGVFGSVTLNSIGTTLDTSGNVIVGAAGDGVLEIRSGSDATTGGLATLGNAVGAFGWGYVHGAGSTWSVTGAVTVGNSGNGELHLTDHGVLTVNGGSGTVTLGGNSGASGRFYFGNYNGEGGSDAGVLNAAQITTGSGLGKVFFESLSSTSSNPLYVTKDGTPGGTAIVIAGSTLVEHEYGYTVLNGANTYTGGTTITGGTLVMAHDSALGAGSVTLDGGTLSVAGGIAFGNSLNIGVNGGSLGGSGTFTSPLTLGSGVKLAPGSSPGTMNFGSSLTLNNGGSLEIEIRAPSGTPGTDWDFVSITGAFNLTGLTAGGYSLKVISLDLANNPGAVSGLSGPTSWVIATAGGGITGFEATDFAIDVSQFFGGGNFTLSQAANDLVLSFTPVPEPSTYALMAAGLALAGLAHRRRKNLSCRR